MRAFMCDECGKAEVGEPKDVRLDTGFLSSTTVRQFFPPRHWFAIAPAQDLDGTPEVHERINILCSTDCVMRWVHRGVPAVKA